MPRTNTSNRQKNKPFKGKSQNSSKKASKQASTKTKPIAKANSLRKIKHTRAQLLQAKKDQKVKKITKIAEKNEYLDSNTKSLVVDKLKNESETKIVVLVPGNRQADTSKVLADIYSSLEQNQTVKMQANTYSMPYSTLLITPSHKSFIKNKLLIISGTSNTFDKNNPHSMPIMHSLLDLIKCSDIVCPVLSCINTNIQMINLDPHQAGGAFDDMGYNIVNTLRSLGTPTIFSIIQGIEKHEPRHHDKIERLFKRFITSELGQENDKISYLKGNLQQYNKVLRTFDTISIKHQNWKNERGYMLVNYISKENNLLTFHGFLKGKCVNANQLVHITGFDDYEIQKIEIVDLKSRNSQSMNENLIQYSTNPQTLFPFSKEDNRDEDLLTAFEGLKLNIENKKPNQEMDEQDDGFVDEEQSDKDDDDDEKYDLDNYIENNRKQEEKQLRHVEMQMRAEDQLEFEDEVEYAAQQILREKYSEYQGLKNFKTSEWNHFENLPDQYDRIYTFKHYMRTHHAVSNQNDIKGFAFPGFYISVTLRNVNEQALLQHVKQNPTILTFLLKHEHKMTQLHLKVRRNPFYPSNSNNVVSNEKYFISMGFRRFVISPIFSRIIQGTEKTKYTKTIKQDYESYFYCSFYYYNYFPPAPVHIYRVNQVNTCDIEPSPIMYGELSKVDPLHCVLERIILTGYPFKIHKRRSTIRFMFFNPKDVKYFKPVEVRTKMGLKGKIEQSLGTHGHMKVLFSDKIKHNDTVCMYLYRRVFPNPWF